MPVGYVPPVHIAPASFINKRDLHFKWRLTGNVVGFSSTPGAGEGILTHLLCVFLVSLLNRNCVQDVSF